MNQSSEPSIDDALIHAYVDDELALEDRQRLEAAMADRPELREREQALRVLDARLADALRPAMESPMPELRLPVGVARDETPGRTGWTARLATLWAARPALAASLVFLAGSLSAALLSSTMSGVEAQDGVLAAARQAEAFERALEDEISGNSLRWGAKDDPMWGEITPVRTYRNRQGQYCRDFEEQRMQGDEVKTDYGVACRKAGGGWRVRVRYYP